ncbi:MAG: DUF2891 family protein [Chloroflexota bacterium]
MSQTLPHLTREYPNGVYLFLDGPFEQRYAPKGRHPSFYGCFDWHSAVHSHWQILRGLRYSPNWAGREAALSLFDRHFSPANLNKEMAYFRQAPQFEMPYGMAWLLTLCAELRLSSLIGHEKWLAAFEAFEAHAAERFTLLCETYTYPIRGGLHRQTAFSLGLAYDWAALTGEGTLKGLIKSCAIRLYGADRNGPVAFEPSTSDFLSPTLSEADLMARVLPQAEFEAWLVNFLPVDSLNFYQPVDVVDPSDGQLAHFAGLNLSRSWMLRHIASRLPADHPHIPKLQTLADAHQTHGLPLALHRDYMISHWVPSFAVYLLTQGR